MTCKVPNKDTQLYELLVALQQGKRLTIWNAMAEHGVGALHQRIGDLRRLGWPIKRSEVVTHGGRRVAEFSL